MTPQNVVRIFHICIPIIPENPYPAVDIILQKVIPGSVMLNISEEIPYKPDMLEVDKLPLVA